VVIKVFQGFLWSNLQQCVGRLHADSIQYIYFSVLCEFFVGFGAPQNPYMMGFQPAMPRQMPATQNQYIPNHRLPAGKTAHAVTYYCLLLYCYLIWVFWANTKDPKVEAKVLDYSQKSPMRVLCQSHNGAAVVKLKDCLRPYSHVHTRIGTVLEIMLVITDKL